MRTSTAAAVRVSHSKLHPYLDEGDIVVSVRECCHTTAAFLTVRGKVKVLT